MSFEVNRAGNTSTIDVGGEVDADNGYQLYLAAISEAEAGSSRVVFDLAGVTFVDSVGLGMLVRCREELAGLYESELVLLNPSQRVVSLLEMTALTSHFSITRD